MYGMPHEQGEKGEFALNTAQIGSLLIVLSVALVLGIAALVVNRIYRTKQRNSNTVSQKQSVDREGFRTAIWASAVIVAAHPTEHDARHARVELMLEVEGPDGTRYPAKTTWWVDPNYLHLLRPGETVQIKIDRQDGMRIYPNVEWAEPLEWGRY